MKKITIQNNRAGARATRQAEQSTALTEIDLIGGALHPMNRVHDHPYYLNKGCNDQLIKKI